MKWNLIVLANLNKARRVGDRLMVEYWKGMFE
jgi:hypothetical protein